MTIAIRLWHEHMNSAPTPAYLLILGTWTAVIAGTMMGLLKWL